MTQARVRQLAALVLVAAMAAHFFTVSLSPPVRVDPAAAALWVLSLAGLGLRLFWGRFLTICFCTILAALSATRLACCGLAGAPLVPLLHLGALVLVVALLAGKRMQRFFEGRPSRFNRWAGASSRLYRLRWVILAQAVALELIYGGQLVSLELMVPIVGLGAAALAGLALQKTWGLLVTLALCLVEAGLFATFAWRALQPLSPAAIFDLRLTLAVVAAVSLVPLAVSLALLVPYIRPIIAHLRRP